MIAVTRINLQEADAALVELELLYALDHHLGVLAAATVAHVGDRVRHLAPHGLAMGAAHRVDERWLTLEWNHDVASERVPFPMSRQPKHAAAPAPVARTSGHARDV